MAADDTIHLCVDDTDAGPSVSFAPDFAWHIEHWPTPQAFAAHLAQHDPRICNWITRGFTVHHTYRPDESTWRGRQTMEGIGDFYRAKGWGGGPGLFLAAGTRADGIWQGTPLDNPTGVHAGPCNGRRLGIELVGYFDNRPLPNATRDLLFGTLDALIDWLGRFGSADINGHRECLPNKTCPGRQIDMPTLRKDYDAHRAARPTPVPPFFDLVTPDSPLLAPPRATAHQAIAYIQARGSAYDAKSIRTIVGHYWTIAPAVGLDPLLCIAQCIHETSERYPRRTDPYKPLSSWWALRPRRNPAGIGVTGAVKPRGSIVSGSEWAFDAGLGVWRAGLSFGTWLESVQHQCGRLLAYALPAGVGTDAQQALITTALERRPLPATYRGAAPTLAGLTQTWALSAIRPPAGQTYADKIARIANEIREVTP